VLAACVYIAEFSSNAARQRAAIFKVAHEIITASKSSSIGIRQLVIIAGDFNGADISYLCSTLKLHKLSGESTHKKCRSLDLILTNAPKCYTTELWYPLGKSDLKIVYSVAKQPAYKALLTIPTIKLVRSGRVGVTADFLRITD
jgi:hypothetical protein